VALSPDRYTLNERWSSVDELIAFHQESGLRLDLGCGFVKPEGFIGLDNLSGSAIQIKDKANAPDNFMDLNRDKFPFPSSSCEEVRSSHFLEHSDVEHVLSESHRILKPGGLLLFAVPYANSAEGMYPGHQLFFTEKWFHENTNFQERFEITREIYTRSDYYKSLPWIVHKLIPFTFARKFLFNACSQMLIEARAIK
jgi:predicted SAM-dependent methyltransferase